MISMSRDAVLQLLLREAQEGVRGLCSMGAAASSAGCLSLRSFRPAGTVCHGSSASSCCQESHCCQHTSCALCAYHKVNTMFDMSSRGAGHGHHGSSMAQSSVTGISAPEAEAAKR